MSMDDIIDKVNELHDKQAKYHKNIVKKYKESQESLVSDIEKKIEELPNLVNAELEKMYESIDKSLKNEFKKLDKSADKLSKATDELHQTVICSNVGLYDGKGNIKGIPQKELRKHV